MDEKNIEIEILEKHDTERIKISFENNYKLDGNTEKSIINFFESDKNNKNFEDTYFKMIKNQKFYDTDLIGGIEGSSNPNKNINDKVNNQQTGENLDKILNNNLNVNSLEDNSTESKIIKNLLLGEVNLKTINKSHSSKNVVNKGDGSNYNSKKELFLNSGDFKKKNNYEISNLFEKFTKKLTMDLKSKNLTRKEFENGIKLKKKKKQENNNKIKNFRVDSNENFYGSNKNMYSDDTVKNENDNIDYFNVDDFLYNVDHINNNK